MNSTRRGRGKVTNCLSLKEMYKYYTSNYEDTIDYKTFVNIIKECNKELVNRIVYHAETIQLPYNLGRLQVCKYERSYNQPQNKWAVDFKKTRELGFKVYFDQKYIYKWKWKKHYIVLRSKCKYKFEASRTSKRMVPKALESKVDYFK